MGYPLQYSWASLVAQLVKNLPAMWETWVPSLDQAGPLEEGMATHSSVLTWRIPMERGAWWAAEHGVTKSQRRLSNSAEHTGFSSSCGEQGPLSGCDPRGFSLQWLLPLWRTGSRVGSLTVARRLFTALCDVQSSGPGMGPRGQSKEAGVMRTCDHPQRWIPNL